MDGTTPERSDRPIAVMQIKIVPHLGKDDIRMPLPRYDIEKPYDWNYDHAPEVKVGQEIDVPPLPGEWSFLGYPVASPLGIPAGPLLNGKWCLYYAALGFDVVTYKTVRSESRACYDLPNLQPVECPMLSGAEEEVRASGVMQGSWAVSFGMPSKAPEVWRRDVESTREALPAEKRLSVSVVGTMHEGWSIEELARDYARCAEWAVESGADAIESNFSCPNVNTQDGQLFQNPSQARVVAEAVHEAAKGKPCIAKIGRIDDEQLAADLLSAIGPFVQGIAMTNSIAARVRTEDGHYYFGGARRGICGKATLRASVAQTDLFRRLLSKSTEEVQLIGVGGVSDWDDVRAYLDAGAQCVHIATAAMQDPRCAIRIREQARRELSSHCHEHHFHR